MEDFKVTTEWRPLPSWASNATISATVRFNDECNNGHQNFAITGEIREGRRWAAGGCLHDEIKAAFPELAPFIKWHLTSTDGPMHYVENTLYWAKQAALGRTRVFGWQPWEYLTDEERRKAARHAASTAVWPELEDRLNAFYEAHGEPEQTAETFLSEIRGDLEWRLPGLLDQFMADMGRVLELVGVEA